MNTLIIYDSALRAVWTRNFENFQEAHDYVLQPSITTWMERNHYHWSCYA